MRLSEKVRFARNFAIKAHGEQKYGVHPYVYHLDSVHDIIKKANLGEEYEIAAYLHDVLEDTDITKKQLENIFGIHIAEMVFAVSGFGNNRNEKHLDMKLKMEKYPASISLKMADRYANMNSSRINRPKLYSTYKKEHVSLYKLFSLGNAFILEKIEDLIAEDLDGDLQKSSFSIKISK